MVIFFSFFPRQDINRFVREELSYLISPNNKRELDQDGAKFHQPHENSSSLSEDNNLRPDKYGNTTKVRIWYGNHYNTLTFNYLIYDSYKLVNIKNVRILSH